MSDIKKDQHHHSASLNNQFKDTHHVTEMQAVFHYLQHYTATSSRVPETTCIKQKKITRFKRCLERVDMLWEFKKKACQVTGYRCWNLTANPNLVPINYNQLKLWGEPVL